jgi:potassium-transporting ATPase potassium-binding subunit
MFGNSWILQILILLTILTVIAFALGEYMAQVFEGKKNVLSFCLAPVERGLYKLFGIDPTREMNWKEFAMSFVLFNVVGIILLYILQITQQWLPLNPQKFGAVRWDTALNTAISFATNTNWQSYSSETNMSYLTRMLGMGLQNFISAAGGMACAVAMIYGFSRKTTFQLGNFWVLTTRSVLYILLPLAIIVSLILVSQGTPQNFNPPVTAQTLQHEQQIIAQGPAASEIAIKHVGTNGGGYFNANSSHPYENPTPLTDYVEILGMLIIAAAFPITFGAMLNHRRQGIAIFSVMMLLFILALAAAIWSEFHHNPLLENLGVYHGINLEGKEVRFGRLSSIIFSVATTATSTGAVNSMLDSLMPLSGLVLIFNMAIGEVIFGGVGSGFIGMMFYAILTMFLIGLMVGRSSELYGKKLEPYEMIMAVTALFLPAILQLIFGAIAATTTAGISSLNNPSSHGLSEIIYAYASTMGNNGSAFAGLNANTPFYNITCGIAMLCGRFLTLIPSLAIAGSLAQKKLIPPTSRFPTASPIFIIILAFMIIVIGALTFLPVFVIGPILEHLSIFAGKIL